MAPKKKEKVVKKVLKKTMPDNYKFKPELHVSTTVGQKAPHRSKEDIQKIREFIELTSE